MNNFWLDLGITFIAVAYGVGMWWIGIQMGIDIMKNNPERQEKIAPLSQFATLEEEAHYWDTHDFTDGELIQ